MKRHRQSLSLAASLLILLAAYRSEAALIPGSDPRFGPNSLTIDTRTDLAWLDLAVTLGLSHVQVTEEMGPGGPLSGYHFATVDEVTNLFDSAGIPPGDYSLSSPAVQSFMSLVGTTFIYQGYPGIYALTGTRFQTVDYLYGAATIYAVGRNTGLVYWVSGDSIYINENNASPGTASWLVKSVPEPTPFAIALAGLCGLAVARGSSNYRHIQSGR